METELTDEMNELTAARKEILDLRARIVALEQLIEAPLALVQIAHPEDLQQVLSDRRRGIRKAYDEGAIAPEITDPAERKYLAQMVDTLLAEQERRARVSIETMANPSP